MTVMRVDACVVAVVSSSRHNNAEAVIFSAEVVRFLLSILKAPLSLFFSHASSFSRYWCLD